MRATRPMVFAAAAVLAAAAGSWAAPALTPPWYQVTVNQVGVAKGSPAPSMILILTDGGGSFAERWFRADPQIAEAVRELGVAAVAGAKAARVMLSGTEAGAWVVRFYLTDGSIVPPVPGACVDNAGCGASEFCAKKPGDCRGNGTCTPKPGACPLAWIPVCGCDGKTYGNACEAAAAGVNVAHDGECTVSCSTNAECSSGQYCAKGAGDCLGSGTCAPTPTVCIDLWAPVCGCDGKTYGNSCEAAAAGVNVAHEGECR